MNQSELKARLRDPDLNVKTRIETIHQIMALNKGTLRKNKISQEKEKRKKLNTEIKSRMSILVKFLILFLREKMNLKKLSPLFYNVEPEAMNLILFE